ncbi:HBS1-like protein isoform X4 [Gordionus sp. m RMFG-2023]|uniref:HBS1-like protein isoform X4 n=1 Tax=Gordionus sp. m RMFG-2023 TaxID=3053472 RepID=UPI0031FD867D
MSRHKNFRGKKFEAEEDDYDDDYDDYEYSVSPDASNDFLNPQSIKIPLSSFEKHPVIADKTPENDTCLNSCLDSIKDLIGDAVSDNIIKNEIIKCKYDIEMTLDHLLQNQNPSLNKKGRKNNPKKAPKNENLDRSQLLTSSLDAGMSNLNIVSPIPTTPSKKIGKNPRKEDSKEVKDGSKIAKDLVPEPEKVLNSSPVEYRLDAKELEMLEEAKKCRKMEGNSVINVVTLGHVDAGKSTLIGHLLCLKGNISQRTMHKNEVESKKVGKGSFAYAWVLDETGEERSRGITMDVSHRCLKLKNVTVNLIDSPGHKDFIPNMITGASQADAAILVIDATKGEFETGFLSGGQTREHAILARSLGVSQLIVAVNKMDTLARHNVERFSQILLQMTPFLRQCGFKDSAISFVPVSGLVGTNLIETPKDTDDDIKFLALCRQTGTLVDRLESLNIPERRLDYPLRFVISDSYKSPIGSGFCLFGHLETGFMNIGGIKGSSKNNAKYVILPANEIVTIKNIKLGETDVHLILAGDHVTLTVMGGPELPLKLVSNACQILTPINQPIPLANVILAKILVFDVSSSHDQDKSDGFYNNFTNNCPSIYSPITLGFEAVFHYLSFAEPCVITKLVALIDKSTGEYVTNAIQDGKKPKVKKPKLVSKGESAECEITFSRAICIEPFSSFGCKELGRFTLRQFGRSVCAGIAIKILS